MGYSLQACSIVLFSIRSKPAQFCHQGQTDADMGKTPTATVMGRLSLHGSVGEANDHEAGAAAVAGGRVYDG